MVQPDPRGSGKRLEVRKSILLRVKATGLHVSGTFCPGHSSTNAVGNSSDSGAPSPPSLESVGRPRKFAQVQFERAQSDTSPLSVVEAPHPRPEWFQSV